MTSKKDREAEEFLAGAGKKKTKTPKQSTSKTVKPKGFVLSMDVMQTLGELGVSLPTSGENVKNTVEELKGKLSYFKENQGRVTKEVRDPSPPAVSLSTSSPVTAICTSPAILFRALARVLLSLPPVPSV